MNPSAEYDRIDLLLDEFAARLRRGEHPTIKEYADRHPELAEQIRELFPALVEIEQVEVESEITGLATSTLRNIGDYQIIREIGRGGMGIVYEAEQRSLGRRVALKVVRVANVFDARSRERFKREAKAAARLHHTNIVPVFEVGQDGEACYYAMQFIHGQGLDQVVWELCRLRRETSLSKDRSAKARPAITAPLADQTQRLAGSMLTGRFAFDDETTDLNGSREESGDSGAIPKVDSNYSAVLPGQTDLSSVQSAQGHYFQSVARIGQQVASALNYAHQRGIIHRDIKPSNLLLDTAGTVWLTDFGLAKTDDDDLTRTGDVLGTFRYMAPERFQGQCDARADIYALGLTLYEMLTLRPAFDSPDRLRLIEQIKQSEPPRPRSIESRIPRDLETIVLKAMDREPKRRYASAEELSNDLRHFLAGEPIQARRTTNLERFGLWCRRNPAVAGMTAAVGLLLLVLAVGASIAALWLRAERDSAVVSKQQADKAERQATDELAKSFLEQARARRYSRHVGQRFQSLEALAAAARIVRGMDLDKADLETRLQQLRDEAVASLTLTDVLSERHLGEFSIDTHGTGFQKGVAFTPSWDAYATAEVNGPITVRSFADGQPIIELPNVDDDKQLPHSPGAHPTAYILSFSPDGRYLLAKYFWFERPVGYVIWDWRAKRKALVESFEFGTRPTIDFAFTPDSREVYLIGKSGGAVRRYDLKSGKEVGRLDMHGDAPWVIALHPDGRRLAVCQGNRVSVVDARTGMTLTRPFVAPSDPWSMAWNGRNDMLALGCAESHVYLYDTASGQLARSLVGRESTVSKLAFNPSGTLLAAYGWDNLTQFWDPDTGQELLQVPSDFLEFDADGSHMAYLQGRDLGIWRVATGRVCRRFDNSYPTRDAQISPDATLAARATGFGILLYDVLSGREVARLPGDGVRFTPGGDGLLVTSQNSLYRWPLRRGKEQDGPMTVGPPTAVEVPIDNSIDLCSLDAGGHKLAIADYVRRAIVLDLDQPSNRVLIDRHPQINYAGLSPDGRWVATTTFKGTDVKVWELTSQNSRLALTVPASDRAEAFFSADGRWLVVHDWVTAMRLYYRVGSWELARREPIVLGDRGAAFTAEGMMAVTAQGGRAVRLLDLETGKTWGILPQRQGEILHAIHFDGDGSHLMTVGAHFFEIWDLRQLRSELRQLELDWTAPPMPLTAESNSRQPIEARVVGAGLLDPVQVAVYQRIQALLRLLADPLDAEAHLELGIQLTLDGQQAEGQAEVTLALALRPDLPEANTHRVCLIIRRIGEQFAARQRWREAAFFFALLAPRESDNSYTSVQTAALLLTCGDKAGFRKLYQQMLKRFGDSDSPYDAERVAKVGLITAEMKQDQAQLTRLAETAVKEGQTEDSLAYFQLARGMAESRAGHFDAAIEWLDRSRALGQEKKSPDVVTLGDLFEAMVFHRLGRLDEGRQLFEKASAAVDDHFAHFANDPKFNWHDWLYCRIARDEAAPLFVKQ